jgi:hypothetical protein
MAQHRQVLHPPPPGRWVDEAVTTTANAISEPFADSHLPAPGTPPKGVSASPFVHRPDPHLLAPPRDSRPPGDQQHLTFRKLEDDPLKGIAGNEDVTTIVFLQLVDPPSQCGHEEHRLKVTFFGKQYQRWAVIGHRIDVDAISPFPPRSRRQESLNPSGPSKRHEAYQSSTPDAAYQVRDHTVGNFEGLSDGKGERCRCKDSGDESDAAEARGDHPE